MSALQDILNAVVDKIPFVTEADRDAVKEKIASLGTDSESPETPEVATSGNEPGVAEEAESTTADSGTEAVKETTEVPAPETGPATEVGMGIVQDPPAPAESPNDTQTEPPEAAAVAQDPSLGILPEASVEEPTKDETSNEGGEVEPPAEPPTEEVTEAHGATSAGVTPETATPPGASTESGSGSEAS